jgi:thioredoxin-related protein
MSFPTIRGLRNGLWLLALLLVQPGLANPPDGYDLLPYDLGMRKARETGKKVFLYFGRYGCGYCTRVNVETFSDPGLHDLYTNNYVLVYVDAEGGNRLHLPNGERITEAELGARLNVYATPLFLYLEPDGEQVLRVPGFKTVGDFRDFDAYVQGGHYRKMSINEFLAGKGASE